MIIYAKFRKQPWAGLLSIRRWRFRVFLRLAAIATKCRFLRKDIEFTSCSGYNINTAEVFVLHMDLQALQLLKQAETLNNSQYWKFYMSSWKHTLIFIRKISFFGSKCPQYVGVNIQSGISPSDKIDILENQGTGFLFLSKTGVISQIRETGFLFLTIKLIKMTLLPHQSLVSAEKLALKYPSPHSRNSLW